MSITFLEWGTILWILCLVSDLWASCYQLPFHSEKYEKHEYSTQYVWTYEKLEHGVSILLRFELDVASALYEIRKFIVTFENKLH